MLLLAPLLPPFIILFPAESLAFVPSVRYVWCAHFYLLAGLAHTDAIQSDRKNNFGVRETKIGCWAGSPQPWVSWALPQLFGDVENRNQTLWCVS
jgi:hypothetical protein